MHHFHFFQLSVLYFGMLGANSVECKPHDRFLACSKAFRNLSRNPICHLQTESWFKRIFTIKRMDKCCWHRKHKVACEFRSNGGINLFTYGLVVSIQQILLKSWTLLPCPNLVEAQAVIIEQVEHWEGLGTVSETLSALGRGALSEWKARAGSLHIMTSRMQQEAFREVMNDSA